MHEFNLIEKFFKPLTKADKASQNLADDVARIAPKSGHELVISKDVFIEDIHFLLKDGGYKIASKLLRTNLSDIASSGAQPIHYLLGFSKNKNTDEKFIKDFCRGLKDTQNKFNLNLIGGDTVNSEKLVFSITIFGTIKKDKFLSRQNAKIGDLIYVSGTVGDAFLGLKGSKNKFLQKRHFFPDPRIDLGLNLIKNKLSKCAIDISDGLLADLTQICKSSQVSAIIHEKKIPISRPAIKILEKNKEIKKIDLFCAGDDYELIFTSAAKNSKKIADLATKLKLNISCIGEISKSKKTNKITLLDQEEHSIKINKLGYEH